MAIEGFVIRLQSHRLAAQGNRSRQPVLGLQQGERLQNGLGVEIVEIRGNGDHPRLRGEFCEKISLVEIQRLQIVFQTDIFLCGGGSRPAQSLKFLHIKEELHIRVPGVTAVPPDDERVSGRGIQLIEHGADAVEHGLECIERIGTSLFLSPQQIHKILLRDGPIAAVYHVCQQQPNLSGAIVIVRDFLTAILKREFAQHLYSQRISNHMLLPPPLILNVQRRPPSQWSAHRLGRAVHTLLNIITLPYRGVICNVQSAIITKNKRK